nr:MAG TPA_asm: hypothetical protein [Bacteriophage sp.]
MEIAYLYKYSIYSNTIHHLEQTIVHIYLDNL